MFEVTQRSLVDNGLPSPSWMKRSMSISQAGSPNSSSAPISWRRNMRRRIVARALSRASRTWGGPFSEERSVNDISFVDRPETQSRLAIRSEEHTSELQSLMRTAYAVLCLKEKQTHI